MANRRVTFKNGDDYVLKLDTLARRFRNQICGKAIYAAADLLIGEIRANLEANIRDPQSLSKKQPKPLFKNSESTGDLAESLGIASMLEDDRGFTNVKIGFDGYDRKGVPNQLKARVMESGTSTREKAPFVRPAVDKCRKTAVALMKRIIDEEIEKIMR